MHAARGICQETVVCSAFVVSFGQVIDGIQPALGEEVATGRAVGH